MIGQLFKKPLPSTRSGAFFNTFTYPTKISPEAIAVYIAAMTKPGDLVLDTFSGSGSTGVAALLCEKPTEKMKQLAKKLGVNPVWGVRNAVGYEIGTYGAFAAKTITNRLKADEFQAEVNDFIRYAEEQLQYYYEAIDDKGNKGLIRHVIWSEILRCPECGEELTYFQYATKRNPVVFKKKIKCPFCNNDHAVEDMEFVIEEYDDALLNRKCKRKKRVPVWIYGVTNGRNWDREVNHSDRELLKKIDAENTDADDFAKEIKWGELHRSGYHFGISYLHQFYTKRNYLVMRKLWLFTEKYENQVRDALRLLLLSYNASHCTLMTRVVAKKNAKDFVLTGAQSGVLYISKLPVEKNIILGLKRKTRPFYEAYKLLEECNGQFDVKNCTCQKLEETDESIDFVFTDPPFGDFIPYAEVNQINELWLNDVTDRKEEIIISNSQEKTIDDYRRMLTTVFSEINRVMKKNAYAAVVFHAAKAQIWEAFENAINDAGFDVELTNILNKEQSSFKQVVSETSVQGDPLLLLKKDERDVIATGNEEIILESVVVCMETNQEFDERRAYSLYVNECLKRNIRVTYDAKDAYVFMRQYRKEVVNGSI